MRGGAAAAAAARAVGAIGAAGPSGSGRRTGAATRPYRGRGSIARGGRRERGHVRERRVRRHLGGWRRAEARPIVPPVDPDGREAEPPAPGRGRGTGSAPRAGSDRAAGRSVRTRSRSCARPACRPRPTPRSRPSRTSVPRRIADRANRSSSQLVMTPSRNRSWSRARAAAESAKAGQSPTESPKAATSASSGVDAVIARRPRAGSRPGCRGSEVRTGLGGRLGPAKTSRSSSSDGVDAAPCEDRSQPGEDARLPVDERAVAVEGQRLEAVVVERGHLAPPGRPRPRRCPSSRETGATHRTYRQEQRWPNARSRREDPGHGQGSDQAADGGGSTMTRRRSRPKRPTRPSTLLASGPMTAAQVRLHHRRRRLGGVRAREPAVGRSGDPRPRPRGRAARLPVRRRSSTCRRR